MRIAAFINRHRSSRILCLSAVLLLGFALPLCASSGRIVKVLPQFVDNKGRTSVSPSLFDRDAYQATLRSEPALRSGLVFQVLWKASGENPFTLRIEARGIHERQPAFATVERAVTRGVFRRWSQVRISGDEYRRLGEMTSWRATLWSGTNLVAEQTSFLW